MPPSETDLREHYGLWIGQWLSAMNCPACRCWDITSGPHAPDCALMAPLHQYEDDVRTGRVNEPGYWTTWEDLEAMVAG